MTTILFYLVQYIAIIVPVLLSVALVTSIDRKVMASAQRRIGPNTTGYAGLGQPIADGLKLVIKQIVYPFKGNMLLFIISPVISFFVSLVVWLFIPISVPIISAEHSLLIILVFTTISIYGILISGWSANCTYSVLGSIRSAAQLVSYELAFTLLIVIALFSTYYDFYSIAISQYVHLNFFLYFPICLAYFITILAETNRAPFDLPEAESELVSGYITEHSSLPFAYFFLSEYGFIISQSVILNYLFFAGPYLTYFTLPQFILPYLLILKTSFIIIIIVFVRTTLPRLRYDLLQYFAWNTLLPLAIVYLFLNLTFFYPYYDIPYYFYFVNIPEY